ncbi:hypothetical protein BN85404420 [Alteracholeplasma palmae J233]|uniref:Lipoprotein n=1 Tax=Alteracholeplasma palmae (strain ATCC 49389 / J233) TaxID=1318466 RepID=U4KK50_ALTPJ|nr:hypothetical protein [Alteracholeplasma palmae]CCV64019.1 hypothetical protein BN85404420 [Alteracholeplasma palmae J233]
MKKIFIGLAIFLTTFLLVGCGTRKDVKEAKDLILGLTEESVENKYYDEQERCMVHVYLSKDSNLNYYIHEYETYYIGLLDKSRVDFLNQSEINGMYNREYYVSKETKMVYSSLEDFISGKNSQGKVDTTSNIPRSIIKKINEDLSLVDDVEGFSSLLPMIKDFFTRANTKDITVGNRLIELKIKYDDLIHNSIYLDHLKTIFPKDKNEIVKKLEELKKVKSVTLSIIKTDNGIAPKMHIDYKYYNFYRV